ncbi:MAG: 1,4-dihydroxy-6-naphthoate synthase [Saprospiraceae bacterium]
MRLTFAFSPCPNDTFMFEPMVNGKIDLQGLAFDFVYADVEMLNKSAFRQEHHITKLSYNAYTRLYQQYQLLDSGSALGRKCGPLLIAKQHILEDELNNIKIAIPGINTTAYLLLKYAFPSVTHCEEWLFSEIEDAILAGSVDAGVIIHENRFTYQNKGLVKILDLGEYWESRTKSPIPLGGIAVHRDLDDDIKRRVNKVITDSVSYAFSHPKDGMTFIKSHAQELSEAVIQSHIQLYVNEYSKNLGEDGKRAILTLFQTVNPAFKSSELANLFLQ